MFAVVFLASFGIMALVLALMNRWRTYRMELFYRCAFLFGIAGSCALGVAHEQLFFSYTVVYIAYALIVPTMWVLSWSVVFMQKEAPSRVFGRIFGLQYLAFFCAFVVVKLVQKFLGASDAAGLLPYFCLAAALVLAVAYVAVLPKRTLFLLSPRLFKLSHESLDERCRDIAAQYALTAREAEIFALLARGRDVGYIEKSCSSRATPSTRTARTSTASWTSTRSRSCCRSSRKRSRDSRMLVGGAQGLIRRVIAVQSGGFYAFGHVGPAFPAKPL